MEIVVNNYKLNYIDEGKGTAVLLLHGWGADINCFAGLIKLLKTRYRVLAFDMPGFGRSDDLKESFCVSDYVNITINFLEELHIKEVILVGHSYGCRIILKLNSIKHLPFIILKNIIIDGAGIKDRKDIKTKIKIFIFKTCKRFLYLLPLNKNKKIELETRLKRYFGSSDYSTAKKVIQETLVKSVNEDLTPLIKNMKETLLIWGDKDTATPMYMAKMMNSLIQNSGLVVLNGGHFSYLDDPITFEKVIVSYLKINE